jgi:hypothetical protein
MAAGSLAMPAIGDPMRKPATTSSESRPALKVPWWKKNFTHRPQHWVIRTLKELEAELGLWRTQYPGGRLPSTWLLRHRPRFRALIAADAAPALRYYLGSCPDEIKPLVIWLLGRSACPFRLHGLPEFALHDSPAIRRHAARALRRLEAWSQLAEAAHRFPHDKPLQWYAHASIIKRPHEERLRNFAKYVDASNAAAAVGPSRMPLWFADLDWLRRPPKSVEYLRRILKRIHRLVHRGRV